MTTTWEHRLFWQDHVLEIIHTCGYCRQIGLDHLSITCLSPERAALPFTQRGLKCCHKIMQRQVPSIHAPRLFALADQTPCATFLKTYLDVRAAGNSGPGLSEDPSIDYCIIGA
jgi:hypothetical protein